MSRRDENMLGEVGTGRVTVTTGAGTGDRKQGIAAAGGLLGAIAASSCCVSYCQKLVTVVSGGAFD